jgi:hypothetical protein
MRFVPFIATPLHDGRAHAPFIRGLLTAWEIFGGCQWHTCLGTSLIRQRDSLVAEFVKTDCTHLLFVDSDIQWHAGDAVKLIESGADFVGGTYCRKGPSKPLTANLLDNWHNDIVEVEHVGTGFLMVSRPAIEKLLREYAADTYESGGKTFVSLFGQNRDEGTEDVAFCRRWRAIGGHVWMHTGVVLPHYDGNTAYVADVSELRPKTSAAAE